MRAVEIVKRLAQSLEESNIWRQIIEDEIPWGAAVICPRPWDNTIVLKVMRRDRVLLERNYRSSTDCVLCKLSNMTEANIMSSCWRTVIGPFVPLWRFNQQCLLMSYRYKRQWNLTSFLASNKPRSSSLLKYNWQRRLWWNVQSMRKGAARSKLER